MGTFSFQNRFKDGSIQLISYYAEQFSAPPVVGAAVLHHTGSPDHYRQRPGDRVGVEGVHAKDSEVLYLVQSRFI